MKQQKVVRFWIGYQDHCNHDGAECTQLQEYFNDGWIAKQISTCSCDTDFFLTVLFEREAPDCRPNKEAIEPKEEVMEPTIEEAIEPKEEDTNRPIKAPVRKVSKMYQRIEIVFKCKTIKSFDQIDDALAVLDLMIKDSESCEPEFFPMLEECGFTPDKARNFLKFVLMLKTGNPADAHTITEEYIQLLSSYTISKDNNYLAGIFKVNDENELKQIIQKAPMNANLNWVDVSGLADIPDIHNVKPGFNGDISLWNVED